MAVATATPTSFEIQRDAFPPSSVPGHLGAEIIDIRLSRASPLDLDSQTLEGLRQPYGSKFLPSLLLWDDKGKSLYDDILATTHYYPYHVENELLERKIHEIASVIASSGTDLVVELGSGNMHKTSLLLTALDDCLDAPLVYYALDVDKIELESCLLSVKQRTNLRHIELRGLLGTYEDGAAWLSRTEARALRKTLVWLGSSIANLTPPEAVELLGSFSKTSDDTKQNLAGILLAVDGCQDESLIECAYDTPGGQSRRWVKYVLEAARGLAGFGSAALLDDDNWRVEGRWDPVEQRYFNCLVAAKHLDGTIGGMEIQLRRGERVQIIGSGKWTRSDVTNICSQQGLDVVESWKSTAVDYGR